MHILWTHSLLPASRSCCVDMPGMLLASTIYYRTDTIILGLFPGNFKFFLYTYHVYRCLHISTFRLSFVIPSIRMKSPNGISNYVLIIRYHKPHYMVLPWIWSKISTNSNLIIIHFLFKCPLSEITPIGEVIEFANRLCPLVATTHQHCQF